MRVFLHVDSDYEYASINFAVAAAGFHLLGWELVRYQDVRSVLSELTKEDLVVDFLDESHLALQQFGIVPPRVATYPEVLQPFLGRAIWSSTINTIAAQPELWPVFVKPSETTKAFTGVVVRGTRDLIGCGNPVTDTPIWCAQPVRLLAEWRCFVRYGQILDVRPYTGDWCQHFDQRVIEAAVATWTDQPRGCALDFGIDDRGRTLLIETNDGIALGAYGLAPRDYARLLSARWTELTGVHDDCDF